MLFLYAVTFSFADISLNTGTGGLTSAIGYVIWYAALRDHTATSAALVQLLVPVLAALGGIVFLSEQLTARLVLSSAMIIGGVALALTRGQQPAKIPAEMQK